MATRKSNGSKPASIVPATTPSRAKKLRSTKARAGALLDGVEQRAARLGKRSTLDVAKYVKPGAAVFATGALAVAGYLLKDQIVDVIADVLKAATTRAAKAASATSGALHTATDGAAHAVETIADSVSVDSVLRHAGLQRRSTFMPVAGPAIGVLCGIVAGSALTYFYGPKLMERFKAPSDEGASSEEKSSAPETSEARSQVPSTASATPEVLVNGGFQRGIS